MSEEAAFEWMNSIAYPFSDEEKRLVLVVWDVSRLKALTEAAKVADEWRKPLPARQPLHNLARDIRDDILALGESGEAAAPTLGGESS